jgi:hypothetical protein
MNKSILAIPLAAVIAVSMVATPVWASSLNDGRGDAANPNFDIKGAGINDDGNPYIKVYGTAGGTESNTAGTIYAYVLVTDDGIYAVTSHGGVEDSSEVGDDTAYHAHRVTLDENNCVLTLEETGDAVLSNKMVIVTGTDATTVNAALTVQLNAGAGSCLSTIAVTALFDST